jgi:hypothetical protein
VVEVSSIRNIRQHKPAGTGMARNAYALVPDYFHCSLLTLYAANRPKCLKILLIFIFSFINKASRSRLYVKSSARHITAFFFILYGILIDDLISLYLLLHPLFISELRFPYLLHPFFVFL